MNIIELNLKDLKPYEKNPRKNDEAVKYVKESIKQFGFKVPIVVDKNNIIIAGHTRYKASKELGLTKVPCIIADDLTEEQVKAFRLADNKVSEKAEWDFNILDLELTELENDFKMDDFGFDIQNFNVDDYGTNFNLPDGDKSPFMQLTFTLSNEQAKLIQDCIEMIKKDKVILSKYDNYGNDNANGNALYVMVREWEMQRI